MTARLLHAYRTAVTRQVIDTEQLTAAYARMLLLPTLKAPIENLIWAEDACLYNRYLETHLENHDYAMMAYLLVRQQMEVLAAQMQEQREPVIIS